MNMDRLVRMVTRIFIAKMISKGMNVGMRAMNKSKGQTQIADSFDDDPRQLSPEEKAERKHRRAAKQAHRSAKMARRMTKF